MRHIRYGICYNYLEAYAEQLRQVMETYLRIGLDRSAMLIPREEMQEHWRKDWFDD